MCSIQTVKIIYIFMTAATFNPLTSILEDALISTIINNKYV